MFTSVLGLVLLSVAAALPPHRRRDQATESSSYDQAVAQLCTGGTDGTEVTLTQVGPHEVRVQSGNNVDAVWLTNEYSDIVVFVQNPGSSTTLAFGPRWCTDGDGMHYCGDEPTSLFAHVHYNMGTCQSSARLHTWFGTVQTHLASDSAQSFGDPNVSLAWSVNEVTSATPTFAANDINYGQRRATARMQVPNGKQAKLAYVMSSNGTILSFRNTLDSGGASLTVDIPDLDSYLTVCAALCTAGPPYSASRSACALTSQQCTRATLLPQVFSELDAIASSGAAHSVPVSWPSDATLAVDAPQDEPACGLPPNDYVLYTRGVDGGAFTMVRSRPLELRPGTTSGSLTVGVVCGTSTGALTRRVITVDLASTYADRTGESYSSSGGSSGSGWSCVGVGASWTNSAGQVCECINGQPSCTEGPIDQTAMPRQVIAINGHRWPPMATDGHRWPLITTEHH